MDLIKASETALNTCGEFLVNEVKKNITQQDLVDLDGGVLRNSITYNHVENGIEVGTNLFYTPWFEFGTGAYAVHGDGRQGWWVYVDTGNNLVDYTPSTQSIKTKEEAEKVCNYLRAKGLNAYYTNGTAPKPFLQPALDNNKDKIMQLYVHTLMKELQK